MKSLLLLLKSSPHSFLRLVIPIATLISFTSLLAQRPLVVGFHAYAQNSFLIQPESHKFVKMLMTYTSGHSFQIRKELNKSFSYIFGMTYSVQGQKYILDGGYRGSIFLRYAKLPLLFHYNYLNRDKFSLFVNAGPQINMLILEEGSLPIFTANAINFYDLVHPGSFHREFILDGALGLGIDVKLYKNVYVTFISRAEYSTRADKKRYTNYFPAKQSYEINTELFESIRNTHNMTLAFWGGFNVKINRTKETTPPTN